MMVTRTSRGPYTYADYLLTPDDARYELIDGELIVAPTPIPLHQRISMNFSNLLGPFIKAQGLGQLLAAPLDVFLSDTNVLQPDILFISNERSHIIGETNIQGAPDLVIEIASPSTEQRDRGVKQELYALFGVLEYWRAYPRTQTVEVLRLENGRLVSVGVYGSGTNLTTPLLPGLNIDLDEIFG